MAQARTRNLNTVANKFYGGMSTDDYIGKADADGSPMCFYDGSGVEIRKNSKFVTIANSQAVETDFGTESSLGGECVGIIQVGLDDHAYCFAGGKIASYSGTVVKDTLKAIVNVFQYGGYGHVIHSDGTIDRWPLATSASKDTGITTAGAGFVANYANIGATINSPSKIIIMSGYLWLFSGYKVFKLDLATAAYPSVTALTLSNDLIISHASYIGDRFYIYAYQNTYSMPLMSNDSVQAMWNGGDVNVTGNLTYINWKGKHIYGGVNINNFDYLVGNDATGLGLYRAGGYQPELVMYSPDRKHVVTNYAQNKLAIAMNRSNDSCVMGQMAFFPGIGCLYAFGTMNPSVPNSISRHVRFNSNTHPSSVYPLWGTGSSIVYVCSNTSGKVIRYVLPLSPEGSAYGLDPGTLILNPVISSLYSNENGSLKVRVGYDLETDTKINVYRKTDYDGGYVNFYVGTNSTTVPEVGSTYTYSGVTYTVYAVTKKVGNATNYIVHCTCPDIKCDLADINQLVAVGTATKATGTGPSTFAFYRMTYGMKLIGTIEDATTHKQLFDVSESNFQITFMLDLITYDSTKTPRLWDFVYAYTEIENDI